jgi:hypothetical protein
MIKRITNWLRSIFSSDDQLTISEVNEVDYSNQTFFPTASISEVVPQEPEYRTDEPQDKPVVEAIEEPMVSMEEVAAPVVEAPKPHKPRRRNNRRKKKPVQEQQSQTAPTQAPAPQKQKGRGRPKKNN